VDPDPESFGAVIKLSSPWQSDLLNDFLVRYLTFEAFIDVNVTVGVFLGTSNFLYLVLLVTLSHNTNVLTAEASLVLPTTASSCVCLEEGTATGR